MTEAPRRRRLGRPPANDSGETRRRLLDAARRSFARVGYDATTNKDVAAEAGITAGAIYHYVASKVDLFVAVYEDVQELVYGEFAKAMQEADGFSAQLLAACDAAVALNRNDPSLAGFVALVGNEVVRHPELAERVTPLQRGARFFFRRLVQDAAARGELDPDVSPEAVADLVSAVLMGMVLLGVQTGDADRHERAFAVLKLLVDGKLFRAR
jgi:AcrR family transcriptional regulator